MQRPPTIRDLAADLGLDIATVSRGLKGSRRVAAATRERIRQRADALGYRPDPTLARLAHHRWHGKQRPPHLSIALLTSSRQGYEQGYVRLMPDTAERMGYSLREVAISDFSSPVDLQQYLIDGGMRGLVFGHIPGMSVLPVLDWQEFAVIECGSVSFTHPFDAVMVDTYTQMRVALEHLIAAGHRRIGVVRHPSVLATDHMRAAAPTVVAHQQGLRGIPQFEVEHRVDPAAGDHFAAWYRKHRLRAVLFPGARIARILLRAVPSSVPCAVLSEKGDVRGFAHMRLDLPAVGRRAVEQLCQFLSHGRFGIPEVAERILIQPRWVPGRSLPE